MRQTMRPPLPLVIWLFHSTSPEGNLTYCIPVTTSIALKISQCHNIVFKISLWLFIGQHLNDLCSVWSTFNVQCWQLAICWECTCRQDATEQTWLGDFWVQLFHYHGANGLLILPFCWLYICSCKAWDPWISRISIDLYCIYDYIVYIYIYIHIYTYKYMHTHTYHLRS